MIVVLHNVRRIFAVYQFAVRLVDDQINRFAFLIALLRQQRGKHADLLRAVNRARGIVRRIENDGFGFIPDGAAKFRLVQMKPRVCFHIHDRPARAFDKHFVLGETGRDHRKFVARFAKRIQRDREGSRRAARHVYERSGHGDPERRADILGNFFPDFGRACRGSITVKQLRRHFAQQALGFILDAFGRRYAGIAERKIEYVLRADLRFSQISVFEDFPNDGPFFAEFPHGLIQHGFLLIFSLR